MSHARKEYRDFMSLTPDAYEAVLALSQVAGKAGMDKQLLELIKLRASQRLRLLRAVSYPGGREARRAHR